MSSDGSRAGGRSCVSRQRRTHCHSCHTGTLAGSWWKSETKGGVLLFSHPKHRLESEQTARQATGRLLTNTRCVRHCKARGLRARSSELRRRCPMPCVGATDDDRLPTSHEARKQPDRNNEATRLLADSARRAFRAVAMDSRVMLHQLFDRQKARRTKGAHLPPRELRVAGRRRGHGSCAGSARLRVGNQVHRVGKCAGAVRASLQRGGGPLHWRCSRWSSPPASRAAQRVGGVENSRRTNDGRRLGRLDSGRRLLGNSLSSAWRRHGRRRRLLRSRPAQCGMVSRMPVAQAVLAPAEFARNTVARKQFLTAVCHGTPPLLDS